MKKKNAFTLVELIAIMVIIGIISVIVLPQVKSNAYNKKLKQYDNIVTTIENAAKMYHIKNTEESRIYLDELIRDDYLSSNLINPITKDQLVGCVIVSLGEDEITQYEYLSDNASCNEYTSYVTLYVNLNGGSIVQTFNNEYISRSVLNVTNPTRTGYTFNGWSITGTNASINGNSLTIGSDETTLTANWTPIVYTLTYNNNSGSGCTDKSITYNSNYGTLCTPTRSNYVFAGWFTNTTGGTNVTENTVTTGDATIYAHWVSNAATSFSSIGKNTFIVPETGYYKLEVWGAQGAGGCQVANYCYYGGYGGYSIGVAYFTKNTTVYIYVGAQGGGVTGGTNGGGNGYTGQYNAVTYGGGGATHMSMADGYIYNLSKSNLLIAAGGGGGGAGGICVSSSYTQGAGGNAGGYIGSNPVKRQACGVSNAPTGGNQSSGGSGSNSGAFGLGGSTSGNWGGGAGGGLYGGGAGIKNGGGGGSGYIGNSSLITYGGVTKSMYCYGCTESTDASTKTVSVDKYSSTATSNYAKGGNGYARITCIGA